MYGSGSSRDWAAKGPAMLGVRAILATSFERIHRSNLIGMGILPCEFVGGQSARTLGLTGFEHFTIRCADVPLTTNQKYCVSATRDGFQAQFVVRSRIDTAIELEYFRYWGILPYVLLHLRRTAAAALGVQDTSPYAKPMEE
uniref:Aconitate hydratase, cytoplasmic n=1 Tax=Lygus hesperus TaxID=30085 RepID=A0A0A9W165_LYGHE